MILPVFDTQKTRRSFDRAALQYDQYAQLQQQVASTLLHHIDGYDQCHDPLSILDIGCGTGQLTAGMCRRYPRADVIALDFSRQMLSQTEVRLNQQGLSSLGVCADAEQLPFQAATFDLVVSSLMLQWSNELEATLANICESLTTGGTLAFSSFSQGTLKEVKASWRAVDGAAHSSDFLSIPSFETIAKAAGYTKVMIIPETIVIQYKTVRDMLLAMKGIGASNARTERDRGLTGTKRFKAFESAFEQHGLAGSYPCTWEVVYVFCAK